MNTCNVSIIIRTLNEERYLGDLLIAINEQETRFSWEIILIDSGSTDGTILIAQYYNCRILHITREEFSFGRSLNKACESANGQYLVIISGHCIPCDQHWLQQLVEPLDNSSVDYVYGKQVGGPNTYWSEYQIFRKYFPDVSKIPQKGFYCNNANSAILKTRWCQLKFDEDLTGLEDIHLAKRLIEIGGQVGYVASACVYHLHHETWSQIQKRFEREALALQQICPELILRRRDTIRYFFRAIIQDFTSNFPHSLAFENLKNSLKYRFYQFLGGFRGNGQVRSISKQLRHSYFYPSYQDTTPLSHFAKHL